MAEFLLEIFSEEIPPLLQKQAAHDLKHFFESFLDKKGLSHGGCRAFVTPRRLGLVVREIASFANDWIEERRGPRLDAPSSALEGFARSLPFPLEACRQVQEKKGIFYLAEIVHAGLSAEKILSEGIVEAVASFPWPKSMAWGKGSLRWIRPIRRLLALFEGRVLDVSLGDGTIVAGNMTSGHRFLAPERMTVSDFSSYEEKLRAAHVMLSFEERKETILREARLLAAQEGLLWREDEALAEEAAGLVEWPVVKLGSFDSSFLDLPEDVVVTSLKNHQRAFVLEDHAGNLRASYLLVSHLKARDGGKTLVEGHDRVVRARLCDADFFWKKDCESSFESWFLKLKAMTFQESLGSQWDRSLRISRLAQLLSTELWSEEKRGQEADIHPEDEDAIEAGRLCKVDLASFMVGEFPELQGKMGGHYAKNKGYRQAISEAIREHYLPQGPLDPIPATKVGLIVSLADKIDTLVGFWSLGEKPSGSRDPYGLRRAAFGSLRVILEGRMDLSVGRILGHSFQIWRDQLGSEFKEKGDRQELEAFIQDRLFFYCKERGERSDLFHALFSRQGAFLDQSLLFLTDLLWAFGKFVGTPEGDTLLKTCRRALNILRIEEKKDGVLYPPDSNGTFLIEREEKELFEALERESPLFIQNLSEQAFGAAFSSLLRLQEPLEQFFSGLKVNAEEPEVRRSRLQLLSRARFLLEKIGDFSKITLLKD